MSFLGVKAEVVMKNRCAFIVEPTINIAQKRPMGSGIERRIVFDDSFFGEGYNLSIPHEIIKYPRLKYSFILIFYSERLGKNRLLN